MKMLSKTAITKMQAAIVVVIMIIAVAAGAYYTTMTAAPQTIKIGVITPLSPPADYVSGKLILETVQLFVEWKNGQGGVLGKKLELVQADQTLDPSVAISNLQRMVSKDKIVGLVGPWESSVALPMAGATQDNPVIMFVTYSWADDITKNHYKYVFRTGVYNSLIAGQSLEYFHSVGWKNIAVIVEESPYGFGQRDSMKWWGEQKYPEMQFTFIPAAMGKADYSAELSRVKGITPQPDVLVIHLNVPHAFVAGKQAVEMGLTKAGIKIYFGSDSPTWDPKSFWEMMGQGGVGTEFPTYYSPYMKVTATGQQFQDLYKAKYNKNPFIAIMWYWDSLRILTEAIEKTGSTNPDTLAKYIETIQIEGTTGTISYTNDPDPNSTLWHQWIGMTQYNFEFTEFQQDAQKAKQVFPPAG
jgi:branched-chain amino acid transport system substrate-binding protein